ncbi:GDP-mannose mannosyl hydrolase [Thioalkalivibrio sp. AKL7]|uniref:GDP-mannose mannosyl hydrolase n=1 Tax=Thioalkalivibrio sp. AKL7 TaxID=1158155 RepID=UPI00036338ED|nr:GDP-mannose mannosyl hydrolase [Thioalkalivibrio sp. AKL7]
MWLSENTFRDVLGAAPLVSIDLVIGNADGELLLGLRNNRPAQGLWFVPGGRVQRGESLDAAFARVSREELGLAISRGEARLLGAYDHLYDDDVFGAGIGTHYVALAHYVRLKMDLFSLPKAQHRDYRWWHPDAIRASSEVHANTRAYLDAVRALYVSMPGEGFVGGSMLVRTEESE